MDDPGPPTISSSTAPEPGKGEKKKKGAKKRKQYHSVTALLAQNQKVASELQQAQNVIDEGRMQFREEVADVHRKYQKDLRTLFDRRNDLLEEIPNFWRTAVRNHPIVGSILTEADKDWLRYVRRVEVDSREDNVFNFKIRFHVNDNPYLENKMIMKDFHLTASAPFCRITNLKFKKNMLEKYKFLDKKRSSRSFLGYKSFFAWLTDNRTPRRDDIAHYIRYDLQLNPVFYYKNRPKRLEGCKKKKCSHENDFPALVKKEEKKTKKKKRGGRRIY
ncbi:hypothetical protein QR680_005194 [Steinernema hermaphroditum]|uniref:Uncharacterized protein n=1 Tax=Steinernema hermaphroditum TaxID=289476 RepID=A0AA39HR60_9BILA|nr:hypothetical protein QR680_005194 [Steinernema hermaphroditum]